MATLGSTVKSDIEVFKFLYPKAYPKKQHLKQTLLCLVNDGVIAVETLFERALSMQGSLQRNSVYGEDFTDGSDAKKCIAYTCTCTKSKKRADGSIHKYRSTTHRAVVKRINNKNGLLRVLIHEPIQNKFYFFKIPYESYCNIKSIGIEFDLDGKMRSTTKWQKYRVNSFKELAS